MSDVADFFLNKGAANQTASVVDAPAFSLTKVMAVVAPVVTVLATLLTSRIKNVHFDEGQITALIIALVAFLAVTSSADVLARGIATSAEKTASARTRMLRFEAPLTAGLQLHDGTETVTVLAVSDAVPPEYLCVRADQTIGWQKASSIGSLQIGG
ncbi:hypothetical protein [Nocardioides cynanchi]|uniref:hypothetical protein n=1 Tax=Nocardioides cynanchi TaxID=2558918 RepID=UPI001247D4E9|nr:hypothetical protein [Nocardioides cynanchi]